NIQQLGWRRGNGGQCVAEHRVTEGARGPDHFCPSVHQFLRAGMAHALPGFLAEKREPAPGSTTKTTLPRTRRLDQFSKSPKYVPGLLINPTITTQITGIVIHDRAAIR